MRKFLITALVFVSGLAYGQSPQKLGSASLPVYNPGMFMGDSIILAFPSQDTTTVKAAFPTQRMQGRTGWQGLIPFVLDRNGNAYQLDKRGRVDSLYNALNTGKEDRGNKVQVLSSANNITYPSSIAVRSYVDGVTPSWNDTTKTLSIINSVSGHNNGVIRLNGLADSTAISLKTVTDLSAYNGTATTAFVSDSLRGGWFYKSNTGIVDSGIVFPAADGTHWVRSFDGKKINILWYGADPSGSSDNAGIFEKAIFNSTATNLEIPNGTYKLSRQIGDIDAADTKVISRKLIISGSDSAIISFQPSSEAGYVFGIRMYGADLTIENLIINANFKANRGIYVKQNPDTTTIASKAAIINNKILNLHSGTSYVLGNQQAIAVYGQMSNMIVDGNIVDSMILEGGAGINAILVGGVSTNVKQNIYIRNNIVKNIICNKTGSPTINGIAIPSGSNSSDLFVTNNIVSNLTRINSTSTCTLIAIVVGGPSNHAVISDNDITNVRYDTSYGNAIGIRLMAAMNFEISNNRIDSVFALSAKGIIVTDLTDTTQLNYIGSITNNYISNVGSINDADGIYTSSLRNAYFDISGNTVVNAWKSGIKIISPQTAVSDNKIMLTANISTTAAIRALTDNIKVYNNEVHASTGAMEHVFSVAGSNITVHNNSAVVNTVTEDWFKIGLPSSKTKNIRISNNTVESFNVDNGVQADYPTDKVVIDGNVFRGSLLLRIINFNDTCGKVTVSNNMYSGVVPFYGSSIRHVDKLGDTIIAVSNIFTNSSDTVIQFGSNAVRITGENIINNASTGVVTSVGLTVPTGLAVNGSPVTGAGTMAIGLQSGYSIPTTANQTKWNKSVTTDASVGTTSTIYTGDLNGITNSSIVYANYSVVTNKPSWATNDGMVITGIGNSNRQLWLGRSAEIGVRGGTGSTPYTDNWIQIATRDWVTGNYQPVIGYTAPSSSTATGTKGEIRVTSDYIYICVATNTWVRATLATW